MNFIFETNYAVFSIFAALLLSEVISSVVLLLFYDAAKSKVLDYVVPIWEVTGTFGAFWVVTGDMAYPTLLIPVATIFGALITVFLILFVARNTTIVFGEFIIKRKWLDEKKLYQGYAVSTLLLGIVVLILLSALVSGAGVLSNPSPLSDTFNLGAWASKAGSWLFLIGTLLIGIGVAPIFFDVRAFAKRFIPLAVVGVVVSVGAYYSYSSAFMTSYMTVPAVLTVMVALLYLWKRTAPIVTNKAIFIAVLSIIIFSLQPLIYPKFVGQALSIDSFTTTGPMVNVFYETTAVGSVLLAVMLLIYIWIAFRQKHPVAETSSKTAPPPSAAPPDRKVTPPPPVHQTSDALGNP